MRFVAIAVAAIVLAGCTNGGSEPPPAADGPAGSSSDDAQPETIPVPEAEDELPIGWTEAHEPGVGGRLTSLAFDPNEPDVLLSGGDLLGVARSEDLGGHWETTTGLENLEVGDINFDPRQAGRVWVGTMGGPHVSTDGGQTWQLRRNGMPETDRDGYTAPVESVLFDPEVPGRLIALGGSQRRWVVAGEPAMGAIWESVDDGESWELLSTVVDDGNIQAGAFMAESGADLLVAVQDEGVYRSGDGGRTWEPSSSGLPHTNLTDLVAHPDDPDRAWVTLGVGPLNGSNYEPGGVFRTSDGGRSWEFSGSGLTQFEWEDTLLTSRYEAVVISPTNPDRLYTADFSFRENFIYRSDDGGESWAPVIGDDLELVDAYSSGVTARELAVHPTDPDVFLFSQDEYIMLSVDGGATADDVTSDRTADGTFVGRGFSGMVAYDIVFNPWVENDATLLGFDGGNHIQTLDGFATYRRSIRGEHDYGGATRAVYADGGSVVYVLLGQDNDYRGVGRSSDGGASFEIAAGAAAGLPERGEDVDETGLAVDPSDVLRVYVVIDDRLLVSVDGAQTFNPLGDVDSAFGVMIDESSGRMYVSTAEGLLVSEDDGATFRDVPGSPVELRRMSPDPTDPGAVLVVAGDAEGTALHRYRPGNDTAGEWEMLFEQQFLEMVAAHPDDSGVLVAVTRDKPFRDIVGATGVWVTLDDGDSWFQANEGLPMLRVSAVAFDPHRPDHIVIGTYGRGFYRSSFEAVIASARS